MLLSLFQMSVTTYWDGAACVDWVQGCSAEFVSMLEDTYTNEVLAEPLSADLNGDFMVDLDNIDFQSTWPLGMADHAPSSRESSPGSKPAKNTRSHSQSRRESRNVSPALSSLSSHQTTSSAQSSPFKGAGSPKKTSKRKTRASQKQPGSPPGSPGAVSNPDTGDDGSKKPQPEHSGDGDDDPLPPRADRDKYLVRVARSFKGHYPTLKEPQAHTLSVPKKGAYKPYARSQLAIPAAYVERAMTHWEGGSEPSMPDIFKSAFQVYTWEEQKVKFKDIQQGVDETVDFDPVTKTYTAGVPLAFDKAMAVAANVFITNINYMGKTYAVACRHPTVKYDMHPWCFRCYILSGYKPCGGKRRCIHCQRMTDAVLRARELKIKKTTLELAVAGIRKNNTPTRVLFQFDANVLMAIRLHEADVLPMPFERTLFLATLAHFGRALNAKNEYELPTDQSPKRKRGVTGSSDGASTSTVESTPRPPKTRRSTRTKPLTNYEDISMDDESQSTQSLADTESLKSNLDTVGMPPPRSPARGGPLSSQQTTEQKLRLLMPRVSHEDMAAATALHGMKMVPHSPQPGTTTLLCAVPPIGGLTLEALNANTREPVTQTLEEFRSQFQEPWDYVSRVLLGQMGMERQSYVNPIAVGYTPSAALADIPLAQELYDVMTGKLAVRWIRNSLKPHDWALITCASTNAERLELPIWYPPLSVSSTPSARRALNMGGPSTPSGGGAAKRTSTGRTAGGGDGGGVAAPIEATPEAAAAAALSTYDGQRSLTYLPDIGTTSDCSHLTAYNTAEQLETIAFYTADERQSVVLLKHDEPTELTWSTIDGMSNDDRRTLLKTYLVPGADTLSVHPACSLRWYNRLASLRLEGAKYEASNTDFGLVLTYRHPTVPPNNARERPFLSACRVGPRVDTPWLGLSPLAAQFVGEREREYQDYVTRIPASMLLTHTHIGQSMQLNTARYIESQNKKLRIKALGKPTEYPWEKRLRGQFGTSFAYPVADTAMRYAEEIARMRFYSLSKREVMLDALEHDFARTLQRLSTVSTVLYDEVRLLVERLVNQHYYVILDDYAEAAELLCHIVTTRRQGYLGTMRPDEKVYREALSATLLGQTAILP